MASDTNIVIMTGRLGDDAQNRMSDAHPSVRFSIASNRYIPQEGEGDDSIEFVQEANWARIICWANAAFATSLLGLKRGDVVLVEGRWHSTSWEDADGQTHYGVEIVAGRVMLLERYVPKTEPVEAVATPAALPVIAPSERDPWPTPPVTKGRTADTAVPVPLRAGYVPSSIPRSTTHPTTQPARLRRSA